MPSDSIIYNPKDVLKKEARGVGDADLGEVKEVSDEYVITEKGVIDKDRFYIPKTLTSAVSEAIYLNSHYVLIISNNVNN